jgi:hypothetical protein
MARAFYSCCLVLSSIIPPVAVDARLDRRAAIREVSPLAFVWEDCLRSLESEEADYYCYYCCCLLEFI